MDLLKSLFYWFFAVVFVIIMFPVTVLLFLIIVLPAGNRNIIHKWLNLQAIVLVRLSPLWSLSIEGKENYDPSKTYVIISNHQSMLDIPVMHCLGFAFRWISKIENSRIPILGQSMQMAGYITIERGNKESVVNMMKKAEKVLRSNNSVFFFPEGTRSKDLNMGRFKSGAFSLAMESDIPILPVLIDGTGAVLPKKGLIFSSGYKLKIKVLKPVSPDEFGIDDPDELADKFKGILTESLNTIRQTGMRQKEIINPL